MTVFLLVRCEHSRCLVVSAVKSVVMVILFTVYGALLGIQEGRHVEICNSFELLVKTQEGGGVTHDVEFFSAKEKQGMVLSHTHAHAYTHSTHTHKVLMR